MYASPGFVHAAVGRRTPVDLAKADVYSVGVTVYELLTGRAPVQVAGQSVYEEYSQHYDRRVRSRWNSAFTTLWCFTMKHTLRRQCKCCPKLIPM